MPRPLYGNPFDGHTLGPVVTELEQLTGVETPASHVDKGYRGHTQPHKFWVWITGPSRDPPDPPRDEAPRRRRAGHRPPQSRAPDGAQLPRQPRRRPGQRRPRRSGYNFALLLRWLRAPLRALLPAFLAAPLNLQRGER